VPRYEALADALARDIAEGVLTPGTRLPTQRDLADRLGVSLGTVTRAYTLAERRGLIRGETGRGTFVGPPGPGLVDAAGQAPGLDVTWPLYDLDPDLSQTLSDIASRPGSQRLLRYQPNAGCEDHREAGAEWAGRFGVTVGAQRVLVCSGTQHALNLAMAHFTRPGDAVLCESLTYPGFRAVARLLERKVVGLAMDRHGLLPDAFEAACRTRKAKLLYTIPDIQNPTTATLGEKRRREIAEIARRHEVMILEDAVHHLLADDPPPPIASFAPDHTLLVAAPSKVVAGGLRTAFLVAPQAHVPALSEAIWATAWVSPPLCTEVMARWVRDGTADATVRRKKAEAEARLGIAREKLHGHRIACQRGGYHVWLTLPEGHRASEFADEARRRGCAVTPADAFAAGPEMPPDAVRISLSAPRTRVALAEALDCLVALLSERPGPCTPIV
jgi:DNA-binding transcriptional MocR family regulator